MIFYWKGLQRNDFKSGEIEALSQDEAVFKLKSDGIIITEIHSGEPDLTASQKKGSIDSFLKKRITESELLLFTKKFSAMIEAGLAIVPALRMLQSQSENPVLVEILESVINKVNAGIPLSKSLEDYPELFDNVYISLVKAGEAGGSLDTFMRKISINLEKKLKILRSLKGALMYPIALLTVAIVVVAIMMVYVVPIFVGIFGAGGVKLPLPTRIIMGISDFFRSYYMIALVAAAVVAYQVIKSAFKKNLKLRIKLDEKKLSMPLFGKLLEGSIMARFSTVLSNLIAGGVGLIEAMEIAKNSISNEYVRQALDQVKRDIYSGKPFAGALREAKCFPPALCGFVEVGEETGKLNDMLTTIATFYEEEFDSAVANFSQLLEPIMIVFLGVVIGFILLAMYMPIFNMGAAVTS
ncbi:MAG: type II secretion system F family protein [Methylophilaceae bacterium]